MTNRTPEIARGLTELAERCEKATAWEQPGILDAAFTAIHGPKPARVLGGSQELTDWLKLRNPFYTMLEVRAYESAAMTLVPEGWQWNIGDDEAGPWARMWASGPRQAEAEAATPALALTAACLRALAVRSHLESGTP